MSVPTSEHESHYAGLATRALALAVDAAIIQLVSLLVSSTVVLGLSVIGGTHSIDAAALLVGGTAYTLWTISYFALSWATAGQTIGNRVLRIRVVDARTEQDLLPARRALLRFLGITLAAIPLGAGFLMVLWDGRRRAFQDRLVGSVVIYTEGQTDADEYQDARLRPLRRSAATPSASRPGTEDTRPVGDSDVTA